MDPLQKGVLKRQNAFGQECVSFYCRPRNPWATKPVGHESAKDAKGTKYGLVNIILNIRTVILRSALCDEELALSAQAKLGTLKGSLLRLPCRSFAALRMTLTERMNAQYAIDQRRKARNSALEPNFLFRMLIDRQI
jgi:hypothetical protein